MVYLEQFRFPDEEVIEQWEAQNAAILNGYNSNIYPFQPFYDMKLFSLDFEPVTILCGGNGSGKSTVLNIISSKLGAERSAPFNTTVHFNSFVELCQYSENINRPNNRWMRGSNGLSSMCHVITSDDIFYQLHGKRMENESRIYKSGVLGDFWMKCKFGGERLPKHLNFENGYNVQEFKNVADTYNQSLSKYTQSRIGELERSFSNGESALMELSNQLEHPGLYIFDEPENSLSAEYQEKLAEIIEFYASRGNCQFIIATHSPFIMAIAKAKIYNFDIHPVSLCNWWETANARAYFNLFSKHCEKFGSK